MVFLICLISRLKSCSLNRGNFLCSQVIKGLVFKKNAAHKHMPTKFKNPRLLLLAGALGHSTVGLSSFDSMEEVGLRKFFVNVLMIVLKDSELFSPFFFLVSGKGSFKVYN